MFTVALSDMAYRVVFERDKNTTICRMYEVESGLEFGIAAAKCNMKLDHFNKNEGRKKALTRMLNSTEWMTKEERTKVWGEYFKARHGKYE